MARGLIKDDSILGLLKNKEWLEHKFNVEHYSSSRLAKELGTTRTTVEKYRIQFNIKQTLTPKELTANNYKNKTVNEKQLILNKRKQTNLELYGHENTFQSHSEQVKQTMIEKYGAEKPLQSPIIFKKQQATMKQRYGVNFAVHNRELYQKQINTILQRYGDNPAKIDEFKEKAKQTNRERYGTDYAMSNPDVAALSKQRFLELYTYEEIQEKMKQTCRERYGTDYAIQNPEVFEYVRSQFWLKYDTEEKRSTIKNSMKNSCKLKYGVDFASQSHLIAVLHLLEDKDWLIYQHHTQKKTLTQIGNELGCDTTTISRYCNNHNIDVHYYYESAQQREVSDWIRSLGVNVLTNQRKLIKGELDIYLPDYKIAIEYCGVFWHSDVHERMIPTYHLNKLKQCQEKGIRLLTLYEDEWVYRKDQVKSKIISILGKQTDVIYARKCTVISNIDKATKQQFFNNYHIQGDGPGSITIGLLYDNKVVAMMTFIVRSNNTFELNRYASSIRVVGGFQKLLKYFQSNNDWSEIISFADLRWSQGNMYDVSGFKLDKVLRPDYRYVIGNKTYHKFGFRRESLAKKLPYFDPSLSEVQNMRNAGIPRIFNCGLLRYVLTNT